MTGERHFGGEISFETCASKTEWIDEATDKGFDFNFKDKLSDRKYGSLIEVRKSGDCVFVALVAIFK